METNNMDGYILVRGKWKCIKCKIPGCTGRGKKHKDTEVFSHGYCTTHYKRFYVYGDPNTIKYSSVVDARKHPLFNTYHNMKSRVLNPDNRSFKNYGGRGIRVCEQWLGPNGFETFLKDMGDRPSNLYSIDRLDVDGDYCPENCRWATTADQAKNRRNNTSHPGVHYQKKSGMWVAKIKINNVVYSLGSYPTMELALEARREGEIIHNVVYTPKIPVSRSTNLLT